MTQTPVPGATTKPESDAHVEEALDEALEESFPASDPVAISSGESAHDELEKAHKP